jgi:hypothetical protein
VENMHPWQSKEKHFVSGNSFIFYFGGISEAAMGGGAQRPFWRVNGPGKMGVRGARPGTRGQNPLIPPPSGELRIVFGKAAYTFSF